MNSRNMKTVKQIMTKGIVMILFVVIFTTTSLAQFYGCGTASDPYLINNAEDWTILTDNINIYGVGSDAYYKLTADIILGSEEEPIRTIVGVDDHAFKGEFDGDFHTIHIYMDRTEKYAAPFGVTDGATIKDLKVDGTIITTNKFAGGIVAYTNNTNNATTIQNCISGINIICDSIVTVNPNKPFDCTHGGFVGQNNKGTLTFENCIFNGSIIDSKETKTANKCTGFVGWVNNTVNYINCTMAGLIDVKPNDDELPNSMANFHRLANNAKAHYDGYSYYIIDYTYNDLPKQGVQALKSSPANEISKVYINGRETLYVPEAVIINEDVTYYGWTLTKGVDYLIDIVSTSEGNSVVVNGINNYVGSFSSVAAPTCEISVNIWDETDNSGWQAISSPVDRQRFDNVNHMTSSIHNIYYYDEENRQWLEYRDPEHRFDHFSNGHGYLYRTESTSESLGFNGTLNTGDIDYALSYTEKDDNQTGFNLIGNPYNHEIYKGVAIPNDYIKEGYCVMTSNGTWEYKYDNEAIPVGAAVMVQAISGKTIQIKDTDDAPVATEEYDNIWFKVNNSQFEDVACINFKEGLGFDKLEHYNANAPMLYVRYDDKSFASVDINEEIDEITLAFEAKKTGEYTLSFNVNGQFDYLHLIDRMKGTDVDMLIEENYSFVATNNDNIDRFIVRFKYSDEPGSESDEDSKTFAWQNGSELIVNGEGILEVYELSGRLVVKTNINGVAVVNDLKKGIYVLRLTDNYIKKQKIVIR
ncbi:MAG: T9SS type A sorting domain-containing protein [Bacteroidales bacterium]|nr:T9SS type A sorting domain-containing protein [Bacteroidales bacterium]